jgi:hypothetical protein
MLVRTSTFEARLSALEAHVGKAKEPRGMTLTDRIDAQHRMLVALAENQSETNRRLTGLEDRVSGVEGRLTSVEGRLTTIEGSMGMVLHGITAIKNLLRPPDDPDEGPPLNGAPLPVG